MSAEVSAWRRLAASIEPTVCDGCRACALRCTAGIELSRHEYQAVQEYAVDPARRADVERVTQQDKTVHLGDGVTARACRYFDMRSGSCAVYPARPLVCRILGFVDWMPCPIDRVASRVPTAEALAALRAYSREERRPLEAWDGGAAPAVFGMVAPRGAEP